MAGPAEHPQDLAAYRAYQKWVYSSLYYNPLVENTADLNLQPLSPEHILALNGLTLADHGRLSGHHGGDESAARQQAEQAEHDRLWAVRQHAESRRVSVLQNYYYHNLYGSRHRRSQSGLLQYFLSHQVWKPLFDVKTASIELDDVRIHYSSKLAAAKATGVRTMSTALFKDIYTTDKAAREQLSAAAASNAAASAAHTGRDMAATSLAGFIPKRNFDDNFISFAYCPTYYGKARPPVLFYHTAVSIDDKVYLFGGLEALNRYGRDLDNLNCFRVKGPDYPFPLRDSILNNPTSAPHRALCVINTETNIIQSPKLFGDVPPPGLCCASASVLTNRYIFYYGGFFLKTKYAPRQPDKNLFYLERELEANGRCWILDTVLNKFKEVKLVNKSKEKPIVFERFAHSTTAVELKDLDLDNIFSSLAENVLQPVSTTDDDSDYDTSNHSAYNINSSMEHSYSKDYEDTYDDASSYKSGSNKRERFRTVTTKKRRNLKLSLFVFGGYSFDKATGQFSCLSYNWRIDLRIISTDIKGYLLFKNTAMASHLPSINQGPPSRGFHAAVLYDEQKTSDLFSQQQKATPTDNNNNFESISKTCPGESTPRQSLDTADDASSVHHRSPLKHKSIIIHGGTNFHSIYPDLWKYSFDSAKWEKIKMYSHGFNEDCSPKAEQIQAKFEKANHQIILFDKYILFNGGFNETFVSSDIYEAKAKYGVDPAFKHEPDLQDAHDIADDLKSKFKKNFLRLILFDLSTNNFVYFKFTQKLQVYINYNDFITDAFVREKVREATEGNFEAEIINLIQMGRDSLPLEVLDQLDYMLRYSSHSNNNLQTIGSASCFANGKVVSFGGVFLINKLLIDKLKTVFKGSALLGTLDRGIPLSTALNLEIPIHAQGYTNPYIHEKNLFS